MPVHLFMVGSIVVVLPSTPRASGVDITMVTSVIVAVIAITTIGVRLGVTPTVQVFRLGLRRVKAILGRARTQTMGAEEEQRINAYASEYTAKNLPIHAASSLVIARCLTVHAARTWALSARRRDAIHCVSDVWWIVKDMAALSQDVRARA